MDRIRIRRRRRVLQVGPTLTQRALLTRPSPGFAPWLCPLVISIFTRCEVTSRWTVLFIKTDKFRSTLNAGAFCRPLRDGSMEENAEVWFADEMTPNVAWTFRPPLNTPFSTRLDALILREYCVHHCHCTYPWTTTIPPASNSLARLMEEERRRSGFRMRGDARPRPPPADTRYPSNGAAGSSLHTTQQLPLFCSNKCTSAQDCTSSTSDRTRSCGQHRVCVARRGTKEAITNGKDGGASTGLGLAAFTSARCATLESGLRLLGRRGMETGGIQCACNVSYVSKACCLSLSGVVWEGENKRHGWLEL